LKEILIPLPCSVLVEAEAAAVDAHQLAQLQPQQPVLRLLLHLLEQQHR
jgi:hypothetical protein